MKRLQIHIAQLIFGNIGRGVVPPAFCCAVTGKMLGTGRYGSVVPERLSLKSADHGRPEHRCQKRILTETLSDPSPSRVSGNVEHRCESPVDAGPCRFQSRNSCASLDQIPIPARSLPDRNRKNCFKPVNHISPDKQWNAETAFFYRDTLNFIHQFDVDLVDNRADFTGRESYLQLFRKPHRRDIDLTHLTDFFSEIHLGDE